MEDSEDGSKRIRPADLKEDGGNRILIVEPDDEYLDTAREEIKENGDNIQISTAKNYWDARWEYEEGVDGIISALYYPSGMNGKKIPGAAERLKELLKPKIEKIDGYQRTSNGTDYFSNSEYLGGKDSQQEAQQEALPLDTETYRLFFEQWMKPLESIEEEKHYQPPKANLPPMSLLLADYVEQDNGFKELPFVVCTDRYRKGAKTYPVIEVLRDILRTNFKIQAPYKERDYTSIPTEVKSGNPEPINEDKEFQKAYEILEGELLKA